MIGRFYRLIQILSIDIVIGVVILLRFFCAQYGISSSWHVYTLLAASVWLIYTIDHLKDSEKSFRSKRDRYVFHRKYRQALTIACVTVIIGIVPLLLFIPYNILLGGIILAAFSSIYLLVQHRLSVVFSKELYVSIVYSVGVLMFPVLEAENFSYSHLWLLFLLSYSNLVMFSWFERSEDIEDGFDSIATKIDTWKLELLVLVLLACGLGISILHLNPTHVYFFLAFLIYAVLALFSNRFTENRAYRVIGDAVFLLPIFFEWM